MNLLKQKAKFKWRAILSHYIEPRLLNGNHGPCPICGGSDRFRFDDKDGNGSYICNICGAGSGIHLLAQAKEIEYKDAWRLVEKVIGNCKDELPAEEVDRIERIKSILEICKPITPGGEVDTYIQNRMRQTQESFTPPCGLMEAKGKYGDAMMVGRFAIGKKLAGLHVTFIKDGKKYGDKPKKMYGMSKGSLIGSAIRLNALGSGSRIQVTEGIETALARMRMHNIPTWATGSAHLLESLQVPDHITEVIIAGDTDTSFTGQAAAYTLAKRLKALKKTVIVELPSSDGDDMDWLDEWNNA